MGQGLTKTNAIPMSELLSDLLYKQYIIRKIFVQWTFLSFEPIKTILILAKNFKTQ